MFAAFGNHRTLTKIFALVALVGFGNAAYLFYKYYMGESLSCGLLEGCNIVAQSPYAKVFGVPLSLFGVFFYAAVIFLSLVMLIRPSARVALWILGGSALGVLFSTYFVYLQFFVIDAICIYCMFSALISGILLLLALLLWRIYNKEAVQSA